MHFPFQQDFKSILKSETGICSSPDSDSIGLEYTKPRHPEVLNPNVKEPVLLPQGNKILISREGIVHPLMVCLVYHKLQAKRHIR